MQETQILHGVYSVIMSFNNYAAVCSSQTSKSDWARDGIARQQTRVKKSVTAEGSSSKTSKSDWALDGITVQQIQDTGYWLLIG